MSVRLGFPNLAGTAPDAAAPLPIGAQIEAHSVLQVLSEGPNGFVYLTRDATHGATRVLKEFMPRSRLLRLSDGSVRPCDVSDSIATSVARIAFMNEANTLAAFQHPALIRVLGVIPAHHTLYRVMPLVDGVSLEQHCRTRAELPSLAWLHGLVDGLLQALEVLHERRLGHGSVTPAQVMVRESGQPLLLGFASVARELDTVAPTQWQSPGAAHLTRHAPPVPADDLPALAETAYFAATGLPVPTLQQRLEGMPIDVGAALDALPDGPGDAQQRRRGLLLALEAALTPSTHARPQSVAEFRRLLTGDVPARGGRHEPTPRWVGEMPERNDTEVDLLISQPAPLSDDLPPMRRPVAAAPAAVAAAPEVSLPVATPEVAAAVAPPAVAAVAPALPIASVGATDVLPESAPASQAEDRLVAEDRPVPETAWPFEPEPAVAWKEPDARVLRERNARTHGPIEIPAAAETPAVPDPVPDSYAGEPEPTFGPTPERALGLAPERGIDPVLGLTPERSVAPAGRRRVERDFAATEFLVASTEPIEAFAPPHMSAPDTEPFIASLRHQPPARSRSPYAAMAAMAVLAIVGVGIAAWWNGGLNQTLSSAAPTAQQAPVSVTTPVDTTAPAPATAAPTTAPGVAAAPDVPDATPAPTPAGATAVVTTPAATPVETPGAPGAASPTSTATLAPPAAPTAREPMATAATPANVAVTAPATEAVPVPSATPAPPRPEATAAAPVSGNDATPAAAPSTPAAAAPPAAAVGPVTTSRAARNTATAAPPQGARPTSSQRTATASRAAKPAATRSNVSSTRSTATNAEGSRNTLRARSPLAACGNRTQFSLVYCMQQQCARPAYQAHPQCADLRNGG